MYDLIIVGAGGLGRTVYRFAQAQCNTSMKKPHRIKGFLSDDRAILDKSSIKAPILGGIDDYVLQPNDRFICAIAALPVRVDIINRLKARGANFTTLAHPTANIDSDAKIGEGCIFGYNTLVQFDVHVGNHVMLGANVFLGHDSYISDYCVLSPHAIATGGSHLGEGVFLGAHVTVGPRCTVGDYSKVSANSSVLRSVPDRVLVSGVPGRVIHSYKKEQACKSVKG